MSEDHHYTASKRFDLTPDLYNSQGFARLRMQPPVQRALGASIGATISGKAIIAQATIDFVEDTTAGVSATRTV